MSVENINKTIPPVDSRAPHLEKYEKDENGSITRLRINLYTFHSDLYTPIDPAYLETAPHELRERGISDIEWITWIEKLKEVNSLRTKPPTCKITCFCLFDCICALFLCYWPICCARERDVVLRWNSALLNWQTDFNNQVLRPKNIFLKTQSKATATYTMDGTSDGKGGRKDRHITRWLAFAFTAAEIEKLRQEVALTGLKIFVICIYIYHSV